MDAVGDAAVPVVTPAAASVAADRGWDQLGHVASVAYVVAAEDS